MFLRIRIVFPDGFETTTHAESSSIQNLENAAHASPKYIFVFTGKENIITLLNFELVGPQCGKFRSPSD